MKNILKIMLNQLENNQVLPANLYAELEDYSFGDNAFGAKLTFAFNEARKEHKLTLNKAHDSKAVLNIALLTF